MGRLRGTVVEGTEAGEEQVVRLLFGGGAGRITSYNVCYTKLLRVWVRRGGQEYNMAFAGGEKSSPLEAVGEVPKRQTGTTVRFWPDPQFFDSPKFSVPRLKHVLRAKAVLCAGLRVTFLDEAGGEREEWHYEDGLRAYLGDALQRNNFV